MCIRDSTGNVPAQKMLQDVFVVCDRTWRGIGTIPNSGWELSSAYAEFDAAKRFTVENIKTQESPDCHSGEVLQGLLKPNQCPAFGTLCTPSKPLGATMVSSEGACAAYFRYRRFASDSEPSTLHPPLSTLHPSPSTSA